MATITFLGAAGTVTGSKYLIEAAGKRLLVDCGLFEGSRELRQRNWERLPIDPAAIDWVLLTHAHIDHTGYLPRLVRDGFHGPIYANGATRQLCALLLPDSAHLQEEDARYAARKGYSRHKPPLPLYTVAESHAALAQFREIPRAGSFTISPEFSVRPHDAGHILGSSWLELTITENGKQTVVVFSGDLGRYDQPILKNPESPTRADFLLCESTYGDREHPGGSVADELADIVNQTAKRGGAIVIPSFAVGRAQTLLFYLRQLEEEQRIPRLPTYLDSPMAISVTDLYENHHEDHDLEFTREEGQGHHDPLNVHEVHMTRSVEESKRINDVVSPCIIISASGMVTGGRILHHLAHRLPDSRSAVLLVGYQAEGTGGRALQEGAKYLRIHGEEVPVRARIIEVPQLSAHAGKSELHRWLSGFQAPPRQTFLVHGEPPGLEAMRDAVTNQLHWRATIPDYQQSFDLST
ncbi:MAG TPA: MBL fold metallo-hydrolase [Candidatus Polarisedimenticolia bacterium]|nr:MBL fold metallo-hydrolase [Candidatus Polarisedimenticolia bacterium]